jgi:RNA polymerase sigma factor (sigma-70 family)
MSPYENDIAPLNRSAWLAHEFERHRPHMRAVAYRMLGSISEAEDVVQNAWIRLDRGDPGGTDDLRGWLTVVVGRLSLDVLRARRSRLEDYAGTWLPEPVVTTTVDNDPEHEAVLADSIGLALLVVLDTLTPAERLAFVLHDVFAVSFEEIAEIVERTPEAARQLASRARRRIRKSAPSPDADLTVQRRIVDAFLVAARAGDFEELVRVLDPSVVLRVDGGGVGPLARRPLVGAVAVARAALGGAAFTAFSQMVIVNGGPGAVVQVPGRPTIVIGFTVARGRIVAIDVVGDPEKLRGIEAGM